MDHFDHFKVSNQVHLVVHSPCRVQLYLVPKHFITQGGKRVPIKQSLSLSFSPEPLATTNLLFVSVDWPILNLSYK